MKIKEYLHWPILEESLQAAIVGSNFEIGERN
jgi:hypothetical protein